MKFLLTYPIARRLYCFILLSNLVLHRGLPSPDKNLGIARWEQYADFSQEDTFLPKGEFWVCFFVQSVFACLANIERAQRNRGQGTQAQLPLRRPSDQKLITFKHYSSNQWSSWKLSKQHYDPQQTLLSINILIFLFRRWIYPHFSLHLLIS